MGLFKRIGRSQRFRDMLCWLAAQYIRLVFATGPWRTEGGDIPRRLKAQGQPFIVAFWHARLLMMPKTWIGGPFNMLISQHRDGKLIADTVAHFGIRTIAGSTSRGGTQALRAMIKCLKAGETVGMTPDGPRGPRMRASAGIVNVARMAGAVVVPLTYSARKGRVLGSWDRFLVPLPFTGGVFVWGEPIAIPKDATDAQLDEVRLLIEARMNQQVAQADAQMGVGPVEPAAEAGPA